jgi:hypothetical protein
MIDLGFKIENAVFSGEECQYSLKILQQNSSFQAGTRNSMSHSMVSAIALDAWMIRIASIFLGLSATPFRSTLFEKRVSHLAILKVKIIVKSWNYSHETRSYYEQSETDEWATLYSQPSPYGTSGD